MRPPYIYAERSPNGNVRIWYGTELESYERWREEGAGVGQDPPEPTLMLDSEDANELIVQLLRGPACPCHQTGVQT